jgi:hypothetical protein
VLSTQVNADETKFLNKKTHNEDETSVTARFEVLTAAKI